MNLHLLRDVSCHDRARSDDRVRADGDPVQNGRAHRHIRPVTDLDAAGDIGSGRERDVVADRGVVADEDTAVHDHVRTELGARTDHRSGSDDGAGADLGLVGHRRARMPQGHEVEAELAHGLDELPPLVAPDRADRHVGVREWREVVDPDDRTPQHGLSAALSIPILGERGDLEFTGMRGEVRDLLGEDVGTEDDERPAQGSDQPTRSSA